MKLAIFDFDGTIYQHETFQLLMEHLKKYPKRYKKFYRRILPIYIAYKIKILSEKKMKEKAMYRFALALDGFNSEQIDAFFLDIFNKMKADFNMDVIDRIRKHQKMEYQTMIVSGAFTPLLQVVAQTYGVDQVIGTNLLHPIHSFDHVHAERKVSLIHHAYPKESVNWQESIAYGDSIADLSVLELVGHPVAVRPDAKLKQIAIKKGWEIIN